MASAGAGSSGKPSPLDKSLSSRRAEATLSSFGFLFAELVHYLQNRVENISDLPVKLQEVGHGVGFKYLETVAHKEKPGRRETKLLAVLQFVSSTCWKAMFGKNADALEKSTENADEYMIHENDPITNRFISVPRDLGSLNCAAYIAGIIAGILDGHDFPARVTAHSVAVPDSARDKTVFLIKFSPEVMARERT